MTEFSWHKLPALLFTGIGVYFLLQGFQRYLGHLSRNPSHELGFLAEVVFIAHLVAGLAVIGVGVHSYRNERIALPLAALVFGVVVGIESSIDGWLSWQNTQLALLTLLLIAGIPASLVWVACRHSRVQRMKTANRER